MIEARAPRPVVPGQARLALERDVIDRRLAVADAGSAGALHRLAEPAPQLLALLVRARLVRGVRDQLQRGDRGGGAERVRVERAGVGHALAAVPVGIAAEREQRHQRTLAAEGA